ncbi:MAG TPA: class F sortase [Gaiellaceae bacterium]|nr:class F sortase [Gaiellaceae bacterium]
MPALWLAGRSEASAGSLDALQATVQEEAGPDELRTLPRNGPASGAGVPRIATRSARLADLRPTSARRPVWVRIGALSVSAPVRPVGVRGRLLEVPADASVVGWYRHGPSPGAPGSAVLVGHVDFDGRRGVFHRLRELDPGEVVVVGFARGAPQRFRVEARRSFPKDELPPKLVFSGAGKPYLTLVTCGGDYDRGRRQYADNVVVFAFPV